MRVITRSRPAACWSAWLAWLAAVSAADTISEAQFTAHLRRSVGVAGDHAGFADAQAVPARELQRVPECALRGLDGLSQRAVGGHQSFQDGRGGFVVVRVPGERQGRVRARP